MFKTNIHEKYMTQILKMTFESPIKDILWFKWWTLAYLIYNLDRFSTDLDIDILDLDQENLIIENMRNILVNIWEIKNETLGKNLHRWIFRYDEISMNIKVELNKRYNLNNRYEYKTIENTQIFCMTKECMVANKFVALQNRFYNRDLYDVNFFIKHKFPINFEIIEERSWLKIHDFLQNLIIQIPTKFSSNTILAGLGEVLDEKQKHRVKYSLIPETITQLRILSDNIL